MKRDPVIPEQFAELAIFSELGNWLENQQGNLDVSAADDVSALLPGLKIGSNSAIGLNQHSIEGLRLKPLPSTSRTSIRLWFDRSEGFSHKNVSLALGQLPESSHPILFTCSGNRYGISHRISLAPSIAETVSHIFASYLPSVECQIEDRRELREQFDQRMRGRMRYGTVEAPNPFWSLCTVADTSMQSVYHAIASIPDSGFGLFQVLITAVPQEWIATFRALARIETIAATRRLETDRWALSPDSKKQWEHYEEGPLFCISPRIALFTKTSSSEPAFLSLESCFSGLYASHQRLRPLRTSDLRKSGYRSTWLKKTLTAGLCPQAGLLLTSKSLSTIIPLPDSDSLKQLDSILDIKPRWSRLPNSRSGPLLLVEKRYGKDHRIHWANALRSQHMMVSGVSGKGKSTFLSGLASAVAGLKTKEGLAVIDPHDTTIDLILQCLPDDRLEDCILHDPTDSEFIFCLPLFDCTDLEQIDLATSNVTHQICSLFSKTDLGFNIVQGIKNIVRTILMSPDLSLLDMRRLLDKSMLGSEVREQVCTQINDDILVDYWTLDFENLDRGTIGRIRGRFEHLLESRLLRPLLANKIQKTSYSDIINHNQIFLAKTSPAKAGASLASILGTLHSTGFQSAGFSRQLISGNSPIFTIMADEFGNYSNPRNVAHALRTLRKFNICLILASQNIQSLPSEVIQAISNIGTHVAFQQGWDDAQHYYKAFAGQISSEELLHQPVGEGFAKIGDQLAEIRTIVPESKRERHVIEEVRRMTRDKFCIPRKELLEKLSDEEKVPMEDLDTLDLI